MKNKLRLWTYVCLIALACPGTGRAQEGDPAAADFGTGDFADVSLDDLLNKEISVASKAARTLRDSPGIISVVTREQIVSSGARDLIDVLLRVPGFQFGVDVTGVVGAGFRGNWGHEGKILLLIDGMEMNENLYATTQFGYHFDVQNIERIEIIRGPGSVIYGGYAELSVINIITRGAKELNGMSVSARNGQMRRAVARRDISFSMARPIENGEVVLHGFSGRGARSDREMIDYNGYAYRMGNQSNLDPFNILGRISYGDLRVSMLYDSYRIRTRDAYFESFERPVTAVFASYIADAQYAAHINEIFTFAPRLTYTWQRPWHAHEIGIDPELAYRRVVQRYEGSGTLSAVLHEDWTASVGGGMKYDMADKEDVSFSTGYGFLELAGHTDIVDLLAGARYDQHSKAGDAFVPRVALTRVIDDWHFKLLFSQAFRTPSIENLDDSDVEPEKTTTYEVEVGYRLGSNVFVTANAFDTEIDKPIVYYYVDEPFAEGYKNETMIGTSGAELELRAQLGRHSASAAYSYSVPREFIFGARRLRFYADGLAKSTYGIDAQHPDHLLAFSNHKVSFSATLNPIERLTFNVAGVLLSERFGYAFVGDEFALKRFGPTFLLNAFARYEDILLDGLSAGVGGYDLLDENLRFIQPYNQGHGPLPGPSRELLVMLQYEHKL